MPVSGFENILPCGGSPPHIVTIWAFLKYFQAQLPAAYFHINPNCYNVKLLMHAVMFVFPWFEIF